MSIKNPSATAMEFFPSSEEKKVADILSNLQKTIPERESNIDRRTRTNQDIHSSLSKLARRLHPKWVRRISPDSPLLPSHSSISLPPLAMPTILSHPASASSEVAAPVENVESKRKSNLETTDCEKRKKQRTEDDEIKEKDCCPQPSVVDHGSDDPFLFSFRKDLTRSDLDWDLNRLLVGKKLALQIISNLKENEEKAVRSGGLSLTVRVDRVPGREYGMRFVSWKDDKFFVLNGKGWKEFLSENKDNLAPKDTIQVSLYRLPASLTPCCAAP